MSFGFGFGFEVILYITCILPTIILMYYTSRRHKNPLKNAYFAVKIPSEFINSEEVQTIVERFTKKNDRYHIIALIISLPLLLQFTYVSIYMFIFMLYVFALTAIWQIPYAQANIQLKALKKERGWITESNKIIVADTKLPVPEDEKFNKFKDYLLLGSLVIISFIPYLIVNIENRSSYWMSDVFWYSFFITIAITMISIILPYVIFNLSVFRRNNHVYSDDSELNIKFNAMKKNNWRFLLISLLIISTTLNFFTALLLLELITHFWFLISIVIVSILSFGTAIGYMHKSNKLNKLINGISPLNNFGGSSAEDDNNWIWGLFYYNVHDKRLLVEPVYTALSYGYTMNVAHKSAKVLLGTSAALMAGLFIFLIVAIFDEVIPHQVNISDEVRISSTLYRSNFLISDIQSIEMSSERPPATRVNGMATSQILRGRFNSRYGRVQMFIHRNNEDFIIINTPQYILFVNGISPEETRNIYEEIYGLWSR